MGATLEQFVKGCWRPLGCWSKSLPPDKQRWTSFRRETLAVQQALRYFHNEIAGRHVVVYTDCKALTHAFKSETAQEHDPLAKAHLVEIGQWTRDVRHIEAKDNQMADFLSRSDTIGKNHLLPDKLDLDALEEVSLKTLNPKALADSQALCNEVKSHKRD